MVIEPCLFSLDSFGVKLVYLYIEILLNSTLLRTKYCILRCIMLLWKYVTPVLEYIGNKLNVFRLLSVFQYEDSIARYTMHIAKYILVYCVELQWIYMFIYTNLISFQYFTFPCTLSYIYLFTNYYGNRKFMVPLKSTHMETQSSS